MVVLAYGHTCWGVRVRVWKSVCRLEMFVNGGSVRRVVQAGKVHGPRLFLIRRCVARASACPLLLSGLTLAVTRCGLDLITLPP